jgi:hypothetical protein
MQRERENRAITTQDENHSNRSWTSPSRKTLTRFSQLSLHFVVSSVQRVQVLRGSRDLCQESVVWHLGARGYSKHQSIYRGWREGSLASPGKQLGERRSWGRDRPSNPVMYATPKPSGTTSPHPYTTKFLEKTEEVLSTQ